MPTPVLHSFASMRLARFTRAAPPRNLQHLIVPWALLFAGNAPDLDFVAGILVGDPMRFHRGASHSVFAAGVFGLLTFLGARLGGWPSPGRFGWMMCLGFTTHLVLDMLSRGEYHGIALAWPLTDERYSFPLRIFLAARFDPRREGFFEALVFQPNNWYVVLSEFVIVAAAWTLIEMIRRKSLRPV